MAGVDGGQIIAAFDLASDHVEVGEEGDTTGPRGAGWSFHFPDGQPLV